MLDLLSLFRCATLNKPTALLRWFGADISGNTYCAFPVLDRPELLHIAAGSATGGGIMYRTR